MRPPGDAGDPPDDDFPEQGEATETVKQRHPARRSEAFLVHSAGPPTPAMLRALDLPNAQQWWTDVRGQLGQELATVAKPAAVVQSTRLDQKFGRGARDFLQLDRRNWLVRGHGEGMGHKVVDALRLQKVIELVAKTDFWISKSLYPGASQYPGVQAAVAGSSVVLHLTSGIHELPVSVGEDAEYPTVAAGLYMATMFGAATSEDDLSRLMSPLQKGAINRVATTLEALATESISLDTVVRPLDRANAAARSTTVSPEDATEGVRILRQVPNTVVETNVVVGVLDSASAYSDRFGLAPDDEGGRITGRYDHDLQTEVDRVYNRRVAATIETTRSENEWMLGAIRPSHELVAVVPTRRRPGHERIFVGVETLAEATSRKRAGHPALQAPES